MIKLLLAVHVLPLTGPPEGPRTLYRAIERDWPGVPRSGDMVSLGGGDALLAEVSVVDWLDGYVRLTFALPESDRTRLTDLGFEPAKQV